MIYYVEDDASIRSLVVYTLGMTGLQARGYESSASFWQDIRTEKPELILLDIMLPGESGLSILRRLKESWETMAIPVIMITAKDQENDIVDGLNLGADDYVSKPFGMMELVARVKAVLRRSVPSDNEETLQLGDIFMDTGRHIVRAKDKEVSLTLKEFELLRALMRNPGRLMERSRLIDEVWSQDYTGAGHTLDAHIQTLRSKLGGCGAQIQTVYGCGYKISRTEVSN